MASERLAFDDLARAAATHAALDPDRQVWYKDILISSVIESLASAGPLDERLLRSKIRKSWATDALDIYTLREALTDAEAAHLVERRGPRMRSARWAATPASVHDAGTNKSAAGEIFDKFEEEIRRRLGELPEAHKVAKTNYHQIARILVAVLMVATQRLFSAILTDPSTRVDIYFDQTAVEAYLTRHTRSPFIANALIALLHAAFDQSDNFAADIMRLIAVGQVLRGVFSRQDLAGLPLTEHNVFLLDISVLIYRIDVLGPEPRLLENFLKLSEEANYTTIVTRSAINEWNSLWEAANRTIETAGSILFENNSLFDRMEMANPVIHWWLSAKEGGRIQTWDAFQRKHRKIETWLTEHGVHIIEDPEGDSQFLESMRRELAILSAQSALPRTEAAVLTDANNTALIARTRDLDPSVVPRAWVVTQDGRIDMAYAVIRPRDRFPVTLTIEAWMRLLSTACRHSATQVEDLTEIAEDHAFQNAFLAVSAGYGFEELIEIREAFRDTPTADPDTLIELLQIDYLALLRGTAPEYPVELLRRRAIRRDRQVQRKASKGNMVRQRDSQGVLVGDYNPQINIIGHGPPGEAANTAGGGSEPRRRYLKGQCPESIPVGESFSLLVSIVLAGPASTRLKPFHVPAEGQDVLLVAHAPGMRLLSRQRLTVRVPADMDSEPVMFELRADTPGPRLVSVTAWIGGSYLGELLLEVAAERDRPPGPHRNVIAEIATEPTEGAVSLVVRFDPVQNAYRFEFRDEDSPDEVISNLAYDPGPMVEHLVADLDNLVKGRSGYSASQTRDYLVNAGARLWSQLIPAQLREQFWDRQHRIRQLTILADKDAVPWELLYPMDPGHDAGFLVEQFPVTRGIFRWRPARTLNLWPTRFVLPQGSLPEARQEIDAVRRLLDPGQPLDDVVL